MSTGWDLMHKCTRRNDYIFFLNHWQSFMFIMPLCQMVLLFIYSNLKWLVWQLLWNTQLLGEASRVRWQHLARWAKDLEETWEEQVLGSVVFKMRFESKIMTFSVLLLNMWKTQWSVGWTLGRKVWLWDQVGLMCCVLRQDTLCS